MNKNYATEVTKFNSDSKIAPGRDFKKVKSSGKNKDNQKQYEGYEAQKNEKSEKKHKKGSQGRILVKEDFQTKTTKTKSSREYEKKKPRKHQEVAIVSVVENKPKREEAVVCQPVCQPVCQEVCTEIVQHCQPYICCLPVCMPTCVDYQQCIPCQPRCEQIFIERHPSQPYQPWQPMYHTYQVGEQMFQPVNETVQVDFQRPSPLLKESGRYLVKSQVIQANYEDDDGNTIEN
ncbi:unnamed protein product [Hymenolepis diminuta]|uniref:Uncharacterized protein n=1 Tax=Hymenolepis diminuta TaxID=6216 RepID=A0A564Y9N3_HYMDI|nr:unnamed protein product [Hymenolepis diminuta]